MDHKDAFLDTYDLERSRGITIFSKQAVLSWKDMGITLLDTPGPCDFSAENGADTAGSGLSSACDQWCRRSTGHTETLWRLLGQYKIPVFLFVNKMDQAGTDRERVLAELKSDLEITVIDFEKVFGSESSEEAAEQLAMCDEGLLEQYLENENFRESR